MSSCDIAIAGAGLFGLILACDLARRGLRVALYDADAPGEGASLAGAGMLAATFEAATEAHEHPRLHELMFAAREEWDKWLGEAGAPAAEAVGYRREPIIALATTPGEAAVWKRQAKFGRARVLEAGEFAPLGAPRDGAILLAAELLSDGQVDNRALIGALLAEAQALGVEVFAHTPLDPDSAPDKMSGSVIVDARGAAIPGMLGVKGTTLALAPHPGLPGRVVRWGELYLVPKADRVILGASMKPGLYDRRVDREMVAALRDEAGEVFPAVLEAELLDAWSGVRPRAHDGAPVLGWTGDRRYVLGGGYRNGILLAPILARWAGAELSGEALPELAEAFRPQRLAGFA